MKKKWPNHGDIDSDFYRNILKQCSDGFLMWLNSLKFLSMYLIVNMLSLAFRVLQSNTHSTFFRHLEENSALARAEKLENWSAHNFISVNGVSKTFGGTRCFRKNLQICSRIFYFSIPKIFNIFLEIPSESFCRFRTLIYICLTYVWFSIFWGEK